MIILQIALLFIVGWILAKVLARVWLFYKFFKNFTNITKNSTNKSQYQNYYKQSSATNKANTANTTNTAKTATMVACSACQLYIPENESYTQNGKYYCTKEHASKSTTN